MLMGPGELMHEYLWGEGSGAALDRTQHATWFEKKISVPPFYSLMSQLMLLKPNAMEAHLASVLCGILFGLECVHIVSILPEESGI